MISDFDELELDPRLRFPVCVIGAGPAGIALATKLADAGVETVLLESGGLEHEVETQALARGELAGLPYLPLEYLRLRYLGGTSNHWQGQSIPLDPLDLEKRAWVPYSGWPIAYSELARHLLEAQRICELGPETFEWERWRARAGWPELPLDPRAFEVAFLRWSSPPTRFGQRYREDLARSPRVHCLLHANALRLVSDETGQRVRHVEVGSLRGRRARVEANRFVLASGGIENSRLLLLSDDIVPGGLGNAHDQVGRFFMEHPNFDTGEIRGLDLPAHHYLVQPLQHVGGAQVAAHIRLVPAIQAREGLLNHSVFLLPRAESLPGLGPQIDGWVAAWRRFVGRVERQVGWTADPVDRAFQLRIRLEHAPNPDSRVLLSAEHDALGLRRTKLDLRVGEAEGHTLAYVQESLAAELGSQDLARMRIDFDPADSSWPDRLGWQAHHLGGTRMHEDPKQGVVDADCKVHGVANLFVAGASVFPTSGHANPTLNLVALTLRLAEHLTQEVKR